MERVGIYIDAGNFYHIVLKKIGYGILDFSFDDFANFLANNRKIVPQGKRYYVGTVRENPEYSWTIQAMSDQTKLFTSLSKTGWKIQTHKLRLRQEVINLNKSVQVIADDKLQDNSILRKNKIQKILYKKYREKGIDVKLASDLIVGAFDNRFDTAILVCSDNDLTPAVDCVRSRNKKIEYVGFSIPDLNNPEDSTKPTLAMVKKSNIQRILIKSDLEKFIIKNTEQSVLI